MSIEVIIEDEQSFAEAIRDVRNDGDDTTYVICGHDDGNPNRIKVLYTGSDTSEIGSRMDSAEMMYGLARYETKFDMSTTVKFVYIRWIGESVAVGKKGRYGVVHGSISSRFTPFHTTVEASAQEDLDNEKILQILDETAGTKSKVLEMDQIPERQMRGFTQTQLPQREAKKGFSVSAVASKGAEVEFAQDVYEAVSRVRDNEDSTSWMVAGYQDANPKGPVVCMGSGEGGLSELTACLDESIPMYGLYRVTHTDMDDITTVKFVYIMWVRNKTKPMTRAKISTHKGIAEEVFTPSHVMVFASELADISERDIMDKIRQQSGSK
ncbi:uncharacterized protein LOC101858936 [Aplysia californica]|uniref:Uncharacterized protein LOC101858936 n=1 Tax=Aplysia californica TaxID=6500 RepID=A0ABM0JN69_APLCA|nr:uncharacterized protein LOC101858936 [Aplysia californica]